MTNKYLFEHSFDEASSASDEHEDRHAKRHTRAELAAARVESHEAGHAAGHAAAIASIEARTARAIEAAVGELTALNTAHAEAGRAMMAAGLELAAAIMRKALPEFARERGINEIEALVGDCLGQLVEEPRVVVRVHDSLLDPIESRMTALNRTSGFEGKLVLIADPSLAPGDCRVEWADGGVERNLNHLLSEIDAIVSRALGRTTPQSNNALDA